MQFKGLALLNLCTKPGYMDRSNDLWQYHKLKTACAGPRNRRYIAHRWNSEEEEPGRSHLGSGRQPKDAIGNKSHGKTENSFFLCFPVEFLLSYVKFLFW